MYRMLIILHKYSQQYELSLYVLAKQLYLFDLTWFDFVMTRDTAFGGSLYELQADQTVFNRAQPIRHMLVY